MQSFDLDFIVFSIFAWVEKIRVKEFIQIKVGDFTLCIDPVLIFSKVFSQSLKEGLVIHVAMTLYKFHDLV